MRTCDNWQYVNRKTKDKLFNVAWGIRDLDPLLRVSRQGVPHILVEGKFSICWFWKSKCYRIFYPAYSDDPKRIDRKTPYQVWRTLEELNEQDN